MKGLKIAANFVKAVSLETNFEIERSSISRSVYVFDDSILLYIKTISKVPYKWGVTKNVIDRLESQNLPWYVILLFESHERAYILTSEDTKYYIKSRVWPLGSDGDYKPATGTYLAKNNPTYGFPTIIDEITSWKHEV